MHRAGGDRSDGARAVVRALTGGAELRAMDWRSRGDSSQASAEAEDRPSGCGPSIAVTGGGSICADLGTEFGKPRSAAIGCAGPTDRKYAMGTALTPSKTSPVTLPGTIDLPKINCMGVAQPRPKKKASI